MDDIYLPPWTNGPDATLSCTIVSYTASYDTGRKLLERLSQLSGRRGTGVLLATMPTDTAEVRPTDGSLSGGSRNPRRGHLGLYLPRYCLDSIFVR